MTESDKRELSDGYVSLKEHFDKILGEKEKNRNLQFESMKSTITFHFDSAKEAIKVATKELERRLELLNELRTSVETDRLYFVRREVYDTKIKSYDEWITGVNEKLTKLMTHYGNRLTLATGGSILAIMISLLGFFLSGKV